MNYYRVCVKKPFSKSEFFWATENNKTIIFYDNNGINTTSTKQLSPLAETDIRSHFTSQNPGATIDIELSSYSPGNYHPRIYRRNAPPTGQTYSHPWSDSVRSVRNILDRLEETFKIIEPSLANDAAYGHELRHTLILACTEVESSLKAILNANNYPQQPNIYWNTKDYVKLKSVMHLEQWEVRLTRTPAYPPFKPFSGWSSSNPTTSLDWYNAYNKAKHDRENNLTEANLKRAILSAGAAYVLVWAQFGQFGISNSELREIDTFQISKFPSYPLKDHYIPTKMAPTSHTTWSPKNCIL